MIRTLALLALLLAAGPAWAQARPPMQVCVMNEASYQTRALLEHQPAGGAWRYLRQVFLNTHGQNQCIEVPAGSTAVRVRVEGFSGLAWEVACQYTFRVPGHSVELRSRGTRVSQTCRLS